MKKFSLIITFMVLLVACTGTQSATPFVLATETSAPLGTPSLVPTRRSTYTPAPTPISKASLVFLRLEAKVQAQEIFCSDLTWDDVSLGVTSGSVQPFIIKQQHAQPDDEVLCAGFFVIPDKPGKGYFIYRDQEEGISILLASYSENEITSMIAEQFRNTTPTPSK